MFVKFIKEEILGSRDNIGCDVCNLFHKRPNDKECIQISQEYKFRVVAIIGSL